MIQDDQNKDEETKTSWESRNMFELPNSTKFKNDDVDGDDDDDDDDKLM
jgi:hypothetical protein